MNEKLRPLLFAAADALDCDLVLKGMGFTGSRKAKLELFEGYSPTIISSVESSLVDEGNKVVAAQVHIFGNIGAVLVVEGQQSHLSLFIYDRSKTLDADDPALGKFWSRKDLYNWLGYSIKAIYQRSLFDTKWEQLDNGKQRLAQYNEARQEGTHTSREAYNLIFGGE